MFLKFKWGLGIGDWGLRLGIDTYNILTKNYYKKEFYLNYKERNILAAEATFVTYKITVF
jgi:hypothetical protein